VCRKNDTANGIARFSGTELFFLVILKELIVKCVRRFGRFVRIVEDQCHARKGPIFSMFSEIRLCVGLRFYLQANEIVGFGGLN
jgi:hypothetical protein